MRRALHAIGLRFRVDLAVPGTRGRIDVAFPRRRLAVFVDGCFWHSCPDHATCPKSNQAWWQAKLLANQQRDRRLSAALAADGWSVLRFWAHEEPRQVALDVRAYLDLNA